MSKAQRFYWDFHFKDLYYPNLNLNTLIIFMLVFNLLIMFWYILILNPSISTMQPSMLMINLLAGIGVMFLFWALDYVIAWLIFGFKKYKEYNWLKGECLI
jgi:hypothetical protein